jgi:hypothetical protein
MTASRRWQDYATMVFGVLLFISPFVFGETSHHLSGIPIEELFARQQRT